MCSHRGAEHWGTVLLCDLSETILLCYNTPMMKQTIGNKKSILSSELRKALLLIVALLVSAASCSMYRNTTMNLQEKEEPTEQWDIWYRVNTSDASRGMLLIDGKEMESLKLEYYNDNPIPVGDLVTATALPKEGYQIVGWYNSLGLLSMEITETFSRGDFTNHGWIQAEFRLIRQQAGPRWDTYYRIQSYDDTQGVLMVNGVEMHKLVLHYHNDNLEPEGGVSITATA